MKILDVRNATWNEPEKLSFNCEILTDRYPNEWLPFSYLPTDNLPHVVALRTEWLPNNLDTIQPISQQDFELRRVQRESFVVRSRRNALLAQSDSMVLPDRWALLTPQQQQAWAEYRQALRDIPEQQGFPLEVVFPTPPSNPSNQ